MSKDTRGIKQSIGGYIVLVIMVAATVFMSLHALDKEAKNRTDERILNVTE